ncbi:MAG TPA: contractile injection system protein, VgrG/Pvc8 family [Kofleriaceae bacterium]|nr:contractile injection system protein, VgrG/Pvc8 family [Kofleriaceae bacterium]
MSAAAPNVDVFLNGKEIPDSDFISYVVERDMYQPDMAAVVLSNQNDIYADQIKIGATVEVKVGKDSKQIFVGEAIGFESSYQGGETSKLLIRACNKMHRLLRKRKSLTFADKTDQQILDQVAKDAGLTLEWKHEKSITYKHVYQHNLNGLEFVRMRAARLGCHVWCVDTKLFVKEPDFGNSSNVTLSVDKDGNLRSFRPRISSASIVNKVTVKGWNPETKELITGEATAQSSQLGSENAVAACGALGNEETFTVDHPIWSKEEADALAKARLRDLNMTFITGEAECAGNAELDLGQTVEIVANDPSGGNQGGADPFNGKYYIMGITHRHTLPKGKDGGFVTILKLARDAQKK